MNNDIYPKNYTDRTPYFYIIKHKTSGYLYAGAKWEEGCHPSQLLVEGGYTTSSSRINDIIKKEGIDSFEVYLTLTEAECGLDVYYYETRFLQTYNISGRENWYNGHNNQSQNAFNNSIFKKNMLNKYGFEYPSQVPEIQKRMRVSNKNKTQEELERINSLKARPGELNGMYGIHRKGKDVPFYGKTHSIKSKEKISIKAKGKCIVKDKNGNNLKVSINDERILSGELISINTGEFTAIDSDGKKIRIKCGDEKFLSGEYTHHNKGKKQSQETKDKSSIRVSKTKWFNNGLISVRSEISPGIEWSNGRLSFKHKIKLKTYNNGFDNIRSYDPPDSSWIEGKLNKKKILKKWINNGIIETYIDIRLIDNYPDFSLGRLKNVKKIS